MIRQPRFQAEFFILQNVDELRAYANVFQSRIARAFDGVAQEAEALADAEYARLGSMPGEGDMGSAAEYAEELAAEFFAATDAVRQGVDTETSPIFRARTSPILQAWETSR